jgi:hypothetical protein
MQTGFTLDATHNTKWIQTPSQRLRLHRKWRRCTGVLLYEDAVTLEASMTGQAGIPTLTASHSYLAQPLLQEGHSLVSRWELTHEQLVA